MQQHDELSIQRLEISKRQNSERSEIQKFRKLEFAKMHESINAGFQKIQK